MENNCTVSKNNLLFKITPAPNITRDLIDGKNPRKQTDPADSLYVRFERCKYRITPDSLYEITNCRPIPSFVSNSDNTYWNFKDIFSSIKTALKISQACCFVSNFALATAACLVGGWVFADLYTEAIATGQGVIAAEVASAGIKIQLVEILGATAGGTAYETISSTVAKKGKGNVNMEAISCITSDKALSYENAITVMMNPAFSSGLWPVCIDPKKVIPLNEYINLVETELIRGINKNRIRKQVWRYDRSTGVSSLISVGNDPVVSDTNKLNGDMQPLIKSTVPSTTYVAPVVVPLEIKNRRTLTFWCPE